MPYGEGWQSDTLDEPSQEAFFKAATARQDGIEKTSAKALQLAGWLACGGVTVGLLGMGAGLVAYLKTPAQQPPGYIYIDRSNGTFFNPISANQVAATYPEAVFRSAIRDFVVACESYIPQTWKDVDYHSCMIRATPEEQKRRAAEIGKGGDRYPPTVFGEGGYAMPLRFSLMQFQGKTGTGHQTTYSYKVRYVRSETVQNRSVLVPWSADIVFQMRPELNISGEDRLINPTGMQTLSFSPGKD
jgi:type IV secretory pathway component VirB8